MRDFNLLKSCRADVDRLLHDRIPHISVNNVNSQHSLLVDVSVAVQVNTCT